MPWIALALKLGDRQSHCSPLTIFMPLPSLSLHQPFIPIMLSANKTCIFVIFVPGKSWKSPPSWRWGSRSLLHPGTAPWLNCSQSLGAIPQLAQESLGWREIIAAESNLSSFFMVEVGLTRCQATSDLGIRTQGLCAKFPWQPGEGRAKSTTIQSVTLCIPLALCTNYKLAAAD